MLKFVSLFLPIILIGCGGGGGGGEESNTTSSGATVTVSVSSYSTSIDEKSTQKLTLTDNSGSDVSNMATWTSSNENILSVSSSGLLTGIASGNAYIQAKYISGSYEFNETILFTVTPLNYTAFELTLSSNSAADGTEIIAYPSAKINGVSVDSSEIDNVSFESFLATKWDSNLNAYIISANTEGEYEVKATLGDITVNKKINVTEATITNLYIHEDSTNAINVSGYGYFTLIAEYTNGIPKINQAESDLCLSSEPLVSTVKELDSTGYYFDGWSEGAATLTCSFEGLTASWPVTVSSTLRTSWSAYGDEDLCSSNACAVTQITKGTSNRIAAIVETRGNNFRLLTMTTDLSGKWNYQNINTKGTTGDIPTNINYGNAHFSNFYYVDSDEFNNPLTANDHQLLTFPAEDFLNFTSSLYASNVEQEGVLDLGKSFLAFGNGLIEANKGDFNGGDTNDDEDNNNLYIPDFRTSLLNTSNGVLVRSTINALTDSYTNLLSSWETQQAHFGIQDDNSFSYDDTNAKIVEEFAYGHLTSGQVNHDISSCKSDLPDGLTTSQIQKRIFIRQQSSPKSRTFILCIGQTYAHFWLYENNSSTYYQTLVTNGFVNESLSGIAGSDSDLISHIRNDSDALPAFAAYLGYLEPQNIGDSTSHYAFYFGLNNDNQMTAQFIETKAVIGMFGQPYLDDSIMDEEEEILFNLVTTPESVELFTPYGIFGKTKTRENFTMNFGLFPFESAVSIPFSIYETKKKLGLFVFNSGDADTINFGDVKSYATTPSILDN